MTTSVAICTYNGAKYLTEQLESILAQETPVDEIVVCDDGSTDGTPLLLKEYHDQYPKLFRVYINAQNLGYVRNFEKAISLCAKDLIFLCDQDDIWHKNKVARVKQVFSDNIKTKVLCHNFSLLLDMESEKNYWKQHSFEPKQSNEQILKIVLFKGNIFPGMAMVLSKKAKKDYLPLKKLNNLLIHDFELVIKSLKENTLFILDEKLGLYRIHDDQNIGFKLKKEKERISAEDLYAKIKSIDYIKIIVSNFDLKKGLIDEYKTIVTKYYNDYLDQFTIWKRLYIKLKLNYYYKITNFK